MKKLVSLALVLMLCLLSVGAMAEGGVPVEELKVGFIFIGDENEGYTANHYNGAKEMAAALGLSESQLLIKWVVPENEECEDAAYDLADQGCQIIFGNSFGFESYMINVAKEYPDVEFCHATARRPPRWAWPTSITSSPPCTSPATSPAWSRA